MLEKAYMRNTQLIWIYPKPIVRKKVHCKTGIAARFQTGVFSYTGSATGNLPEAVYPDRQEGA